MSAPRWTTWLVRRLAPPELADEAVGDLAEAHRARLSRHRAWVAAALTALEALDVAAALARERGRSAPRTAPAPRGFRLPGWSWLDLKLGIRMLAKHPGLSLVAVLGMAVGVAVGAATFGVIHALIASPLPLDEGERVVTIQNVDTEDAKPAHPTHLHDLESWRTELSALRDPSAYRIVTRNVVAADGRAKPERVVEMTASGFRLARVPPLLGRTLDVADERSGAPAVVVIGHGVWQSRFGGRADVVGRTLRVGATTHTVVGVMPRGFAFPIADRVWTPLRLVPHDFERGRAPAVNVFARLGPGVTLEEARAQLETVGRRAAASYPDTHARIRPRLLPYTQELAQGPVGFGLQLARILASGVLIAIAVNVAALTYARTTTRLGEIAVRTALGASRGRIAAQLFAEALLLSVLAAAGGLLAARWALARVGAYVARTSGGQVPFWWRFELTAETVVYAVGLALLAAGIVGVVPALGATGRRVGAGLHRIGAGGPRLGRVWTVLVVAQVASAVAILPVALNATGMWLRSRGAPSARAIEESLQAWIYLDREELGDLDRESEAAGFLPRYAELRDRLVRRLEGEPWVSHVVVMESAPWEDPDIEVELEGGARPVAAAGAAPATRAGVSRVVPGFFAAFELPVLDGRALQQGDGATGAPVVVVDRVFVDRLLGGGAAVGRRIRFAALPPTRQRVEGAGGPVAATWYTIVGVVSGLDTPAVSLPEPKIFLPVTREVRYPTALALRVRGGDPERYAARARALALEVDPMLRLADLGPLDARYGLGESPDLMLATLGALSLVGVLLAVAGLYALMSFTVAGRRREIGIRAALGARPHRIVGAILVRAFAQIAAGIAAGTAVAGFVDGALGSGLLSGRRYPLLATVAMVMALAGLLAAWGPARAGLRVQPTEALRAD